jgi:peptidyl-prolyl cis-trans isomerase A (cyclophilin A)
MNTRVPLAGALVLIALASGCGGEPPAKTAGGPDLSNPLLYPARLDERAPDSFRVRFRTSKGDFVVEVHRAWAPNGADRFYNLVKNGFYDRDRLYRVVKGFMVQFGLNGDPLVNAQWKDKYLVDDPVRQSNKRGRVSFAKGGPNSRTTEVFVNEKDNPSLDQEGFSPFGEVVSGMKVVTSFYDAYGDGPPRGTGPWQAQVQARGNAWLDEHYPKLDSIQKAVIEH